MEKLEKLGENNCLRFANPAEATWRLEAWKIVDPLSFFETSQGGGHRRPNCWRGPPCSPSRSTFLLSLCVLARSWQVLDKFLAFLGVLGHGQFFFWPKTLPKPSQDPPQTLQNRAWSFPRRHFEKTFNLRRPQGSCTKVFGGQNGQLGSNSIELPQGGATAASPFVCKNVGGLPCIEGLHLQDCIGEGTWRW